MSLGNQVKHSLTRFSKENDHFLLAVSGGKDSMVLFDMMHQLKLEFAVAHMNYGLREESDLDEEFVRKVADDRGIRFFSKRVDTKSFCLENGYAIQEGARILRYSWFESLLSEHNLDWIVTAHHEEDNKETFIQNLKRGSGLRGLKSMKANHGNRLKPLLWVPRNEIDKYAEECKVNFRQDVSNNQNHYQRNLIRNKILPFLENELPGFGKGIKNSIKNLQLDYDFMETVLKNLSKQHLLQEDDGWKIENYKSLHPRLLFYILEQFEFNYEQVEDILSSKSSGKKLMNSSFEVIDGHRDLYIHIVRPIDEFKLEVNGVGDYDLKNGRLKIAVSEFPEVFTKDKSVAYIDADKLNWPLEVRNYQPGDRIKPIGMNGSKKLSDYFTDSKIPVHLRSAMKVVVSDGEIIWVVGELVSENAKLTSDTKKVLRFETY